MTKTVLDHGADVEVDDEIADHTLTPDRVEILNSGMVLLFFKSQYEKWVVPREKIEAMYTHTRNEEENAEWWE